ncbi:MAG: glycosyltransferase family 4 protein [Nibricoccus sp.]
MKKVLLLAPELFASEGGIPRILRLYLKALCELAQPFGHVDLLVLNDTVFDSRDLRRYSDKRLEAWEACNRKKFHFGRATLRHAKRADQIVCGHIGQLPAAWLAQRFRPKLRYSLVAHGIEVWRPFTFLERLALKRAHRILCVSEFTRRELLKHAKIPADRAVVLPNALDPHLTTLPHDSEAPAGTNADILTISRLSKADNYKGIDHLIESMPQIRQEIPAARLRVVGRGDDLPRLQSIASKLHLSDAVRFLGYVGDDDLRREIRDCRVFALPSHREGFGLVYLEAMAQGKPCVAARSGGAPEVLSPETGVLAEYANIPALSQACIHALRREWNPKAITARADLFSYSHFRDKLGSILFA